MKIEHVVYNEEHVMLKSFLNSNWYDTATPYQFCISELKELKNEWKSKKTKEPLYNGSYIKSLRYSIN